MSEDSGSADTDSVTEAAPTQESAPEEIRVDPSEGTPMAASSDTAVESSEYDDRDVRVPRNSTDALAETPSGEPSIEDEVRRMAAEEPEAAPTPAAPGAPEDEPEAVPMAASASDDAGEAVDASTEEPAPPVEAAPAEPVPSEEARTAPVVPRRVATPPMAAAHEAFSQAVRAHAGLKGLKMEDQSAYLQILHPATGHKIYVALQSKTPKVHIETTLPIVGQFGAAAPKKTNGRIQAVLDPAIDSEEEMRNVLSLLDLLASGQSGALPPPKRRSPAEQ